MDLTEFHKKTKKKNPAVSRRAVDRNLRVPVSTHSLDTGEVWQQCCTGRLNEDSFKSLIWVATVSAVTRHHQTPTWRAAMFWKISSHPFWKMSGKSTSGYWFNLVGGSSGCNTFRDHTFPCSVHLSFGMVCVFVFYVAIPVSFN